MARTVRKFMCLLRKSFLIRKRYWGQTFLLQIGLSVVAYLLLGFSGSVLNYLSTTLNSQREVVDDAYYEKLDLIPSLYNSSLSLIRFTPNVTVTQDLMKSVGDCLKLDRDRIHGSADEETMLTEFQLDKIGKEEGFKPGGIIFETITDNSTLPTIFKYKLRFLSSPLYEPYIGGDASDDIIDDRQLLPLQICIDKTFIDKISGSSLSSLNTTISVQKMPVPSHEKKLNYNISYLQKSISLMFIVCMIYVQINESRFPTHEKNTGVNIMMSINGVGEHMNLLSWLVSGAIWSSVYIGLGIVILKFFQPLDRPVFLQYGNPVVVWLALLLQAIHMICFGYHLVAYFPKFAYVVFVAMMIPYLMAVGDNYLTNERNDYFFSYLGILSPPFLVKRMLQEILAYEEEKIGIGFSNMFVVSPSESPVEVSFGMMMLFSILGSIIHFYMAVYISELRPGKYGVKRHPLFCFQKKNKVEENQTHLTSEELKIENREFESVPEGSLEPGIRIRGLKKSYMTNWLKKTEVHALNGVSVDFYKGQITALLGQNGAGKTTMMSILSGLEDSTEGVVFIDNKNIQVEPETIRNNISLCPQENIVFPDLNVYEQLMFFGTLKAADGKSKRQLEEEVDILLAKVNLTEKKSTLPNQLSGGQKRRLCLAMAVIGDGNVLILDEPTSGMDAESKREVWDLILETRGHKTILISTHDMEEADILGDRIATMSAGKLKSYGTAMFLKKLYGDGQVEVTLSVEPRCNTATIFEEIETNVSVLSEGDGKIVLAIPRSESLPKILDKLELSKERLGITGMSVSTITLEQVFLKITKKEGDEIEADHPIRLLKKTTGLSYFLQSFTGYFIKKFVYHRKNPWTFWINFLLPCASAVFLLLAKPSLPETISLTLDTYSPAKAFVYADQPILSQLYQKTIADFSGEASVIPGNMSVTNALMNFAKQDGVEYKNKMIVSAEFNGTGSEVLVNGFYSGSARRGIPMTLNCISNTLAKALTGNNKTQIQFSTQQLLTTEMLDTWSVNQNTMRTNLMFYVLVIVIVSYLIQPLCEARTGIKQLQDMTGASKISYWGAMFIFDIIKYGLSVVLLVTAFWFVDHSFGTKFYLAGEILVFIAFLMLFGISCLLLVYTISFWKLTLNTTTIFLTTVPIVVRMLGDIMLMILNLMINSKLSTFNQSINNQKLRINRIESYRNIHKYIFLSIPQLNFIVGHQSFFKTVLINARCRRMTDNIIAAVCSATDGRPVNDVCCAMDCSGGICNNPKSYWSKSELGTSLGESVTFLAASSVIFFIIIIISEQKLIDKLLVRIRRKNTATYTSGMDELVEKEKEIVKSEVWKRVNNAVEDDNENVFLAHELKKSYGNLEVVKGTSFRVKEGQCFGLLGVNGAGKSTTFKMLTGMEIPHDGTMYLKSYGIHDNRTKYLAEMGYCPQQDAMIETLNAWDHLILFARLRGVPPGQINFVVKSWITKLNLSACAEQPSGTYSGGNKRRLNIAMALIGNPSLVLLDEPTTGVDPAARRSLWNTLKSCQESGQSIILTSHSMEECEVMCDRLVIMVKGQIVCVGAVQELKQRFGAGYNVHVKMSPVSPTDDVQEIKRRIESGIRCRKMDENPGFLDYHVTDPEATWTSMYGLMTTLKNQFDCIEDFVVLSSTFEQLFIQFARAPEDNALEDVAV